MLGLQSSTSSSSSLKFCGEGGAGGGGAGLIGGDSCPPPGVAARFIDTSFSPLPTSRQYAKQYQAKKQIYQTETPGSLQGSAATYLRRGGKEVELHLPPPLISKYM